MQTNGSVRGRVKDSYSTPSTWNRIQQTPELLSLIFVQCLPVYNMIPDAKTAPMLLLAVCRSWRYLALATPQLWSQLRLKVPYYSTDEGAERSVQLLKQFRCMLNTFLLRSGAVPLSLDINLSNAMSDAGIESYGATAFLTNLITSSIFPYAHKWRHLTLSSSLSDILPVFYFLKSGSPQALTALALDFSCTPIIVPYDQDVGMAIDSLTEDRQSQLTIPLSLAGLSRLETFSLYGNSDSNICFIWDLNRLPSTVKNILLWDVRLQCKLVSPLQIHMNSLQTLRLRSTLSMETLISILLSSPELEELTLDVQISEDYKTYPGIGYKKVVLMSKLRALRFCANETTTEFLDYLILPSLITLDFVIENDSNGPEALRRIQTLVMKSQTKLISLVLNDGQGDIEEDNIIHFLHQVPYLQELRILKQNMSDRILNALTPVHGESNNSIPCNSSPSSLCPGLTSITFTSRNDFSPQSISKLIISRTHRHKSEERCQYPEHICETDSHNGALRLFQAVVPDPGSVYEQPRIKDCIRKGFHLVLQKAIGIPFSV